MIAVTGATGVLGGRVAARLATHGADVRLVVRDPERAPELPGAEVSPPADYGDGAAMRAAFEGADVVYLVSAPEAPGRVELHTTAVDAAQAAGVAHIVYVSFVGAAPRATFTFARDHWATEEHIGKAGMRHTFLRSSVYLELLAFARDDDGVIRGPAGNGKVAPVARDDVADVAVAVLLAPAAHDGGVYDVTGPEALTLYELADRFARATGEPYSFEHETIEEAWASRAASGAADWMIEGWISSYAAIATGELNVVSDTVLRLTRHPPQTIEDFVRLA